MKKLSLRKIIVGFGLLTLLASVPLSSNQASVAPSRYRFYVEADTRSHLRRLAGWLNANEFDVAGVDLKRGTLEVLTSERGIEFLKSNGMKGRLVLVPVAGGKQTNLSDLDNRYLDPAKVAAKMGEIHARYPNVTRVLEIGRSLENRPILALVVSTTPDLADPRFHDKPTILFDGMHHAREIMTPEIVFDIGESILGAAGRSEDARRTLETMNVVLVPMLNVDGNARVWTSDTMWRKNARSEGSSTFGVDINRNYSYRWNGCSGSSGSRGAQDYRGTAAASEPETRALMALANRVHPMASVSYHSYSELVLYPYGCDGDFTGENALLSSLGREMASRLPSDSGKGNYTPGTPWEILYSVDGDSMGYMFATFGAVAFTFEVNEQFQPPYEMREPTVRKHRVAWQYLINQLQAKMLAVQVRDTAGRPVVADITIAEIQHTKGERDFSTNAGGNYFKALPPGSYTLRARTADGKIGTTNVSIGSRPANVSLVVR